MSTRSEAPDRASARKGADKGADKGPDRRALVAEVRLERWADVSGDMADPGQPTARPGSSGAVRPSFLELC
ncbi:hypothetical protein GCM10007886_35460 [Methylobacterium gregans]|nr:hypothetical protein GCM10007886_35460 [Methylobacterium gregans]